MNWSKGKCNRYLDIWNVSHEEELHRHAKCADKQSQIEMQCLYSFWKMKIEMMEIMNVEKIEMIKKMMKEKKVKQQKVVYKQYLNEKNEMKKMKMKEIKIEMKKAEFFGDIDWVQCWNFEGIKEQKDEK